MPDREREVLEFRAALCAVLDAAVPDPLPDRGTIDARMLWRSLGAAGLVSVLYTGSVDGRHDIDPTRLDTLLTELDARLPLGVVLAICVMVATVVPLLAECGGTDPSTTTVARAALDGVLAGKAIVALAVTDSAAAGSDLLHAATQAKIADVQVVVTGTKRWITNATHCDYALVLCRHREPNHFTSFCWVLVPASAAGVSFTPASSTAFAGSGVGHVHFDAVVLGVEQVIGGRGRALASFARHVGTERLASALWARAICRRALTGTHHWLQGRPAAGATLWDNPAVRERFARCLVDLTQLDALCGQWILGPTGMRSPANAMVLKAAAAGIVDRVLTECVSLRGADSFGEGGDADLRSEAAMFGIAGGASGAMLAGIADHANELLRTAR